MSDRREEILNQEHRKLVEEKGISSIHTTNFPEAYKFQTFAAMDEYMEETCLELLEYMSNNCVICGSFHDSGKFYFKGEWITKESLFENFL